MPAPLRKDDTTGTTRRFSSPFGSTACLFEIARRCPGSIPRLAIGLLIFVSFAGVAVAANELFGPAALRYPAGTSAVDLATGDLDADGVRDLAVADSEGNTVRLLRGTGDGRLDPLATIAVDGRPGSLVLADFDADARADVAIAAAQSGRVSLLPAPDFAPVTLIELGTGTGPHPLAAGGFDGDGDLDLAGVDAQGGTVHLLSATADGTFEPLASAAVGGQPGAVVFEDFNGDAWDEAVVSDTQSGRVRLLTAPGFEPVLLIELGIGTGPDPLVSGDFDGDGRVDLAVVSAASSKVTVLAGRAPGGECAEGARASELT